MAAALLATACGARLSPSQLTVARGRAGGTQVVAGGGGSGSGVAAGGDSTGASSGGTNGATGASPGASNAGPAGATRAGASTGGAGAARNGSLPSGIAAGGATTPGAASRAGATTTAACAAGAGGNGPTDVGVTPTEIDLGNVTTLGGPVPGLFAGAYYGALAFAAYQNSMGGVCGRKLAIKSKDDQLDAGQNKAAVDSLNGQVLGYVGSFSVNDEAGASDMQSAGVPDVGYSLSHQRGAISVNYSPQPAPAGWRLGPLTYFKQKFGPSVITKIAFFTEDIQSAKDAAAGQLAAAQSLGYKVVYSRTLEPNEANFQGDVFNMQSKGVKGLILSGDVGTMSRLAKAIKDGGLSIPFANWGASAYDPGFISMSGGGAEGAVLDQNAALFAGEDAGVIPEVALFNTWLKRVSPGQVPDLFAAYAWASVRLLVQALTKVGPNVTRKALLAALSTIHSFDDNGMLPSADPAGKQPPTCWLEVDVKGGRFQRGGIDPPSGFVCNPGGFLKQ